jgi:hypothetical protein
VTLTDAAARLWPTPQAHDEKSPKAAEQIERARRGAKRRTDGGPPGVANLNEMASLWPTPTHANPNETENPQEWLARAEKLKEKGINGNGAGMPLGIAAQLWPTPMKADVDRGSGTYMRGNPTLKGAARDWPTPTAQDSKASGAAGYSTESGRHSGTTLTDAAVRETWATPTARDGDPRRRGKEAKHSKGGRSLAEDLESFPISASLPGPKTPTDGADGSKPADLRLLRRRLNPYFVESLMGLPPGWTVVDLRPWGMPSSLSKRPSRGNS